MKVHLATLGAGVVALPVPEAMEALEVVRALFLAESLAESLAGRRVADGEVLVGGVPAIEPRAGQPTC